MLWFNDLHINLKIYPKISRENVIMWDVEKLEKEGKEEKKKGRRGDEK